MRKRPTKQARNHHRQRARRMKCMLVARWLDRIDTNLVYVDVYSGTRYGIYIIWEQNGSGYMEQCTHEPPLYSVLFHIYHSNRCSFSEKLTVHTALDKMNIQKPSLLLHAVSYTLSLSLSLPPAPHLVYAAFPSSFHIFMHNSIHFNIFTLLTGMDGERESDIHTTCRQTSTGMLCI